jgi:hypothetical protein
VKAIAIVGALAGAAAAGTPIVTPPPGWTGGANAELVTRTGGEGHFGGVHGVVEAERYAPPETGVVLYATRISATSAARDIAARAEIDALRPSAPTRWHVDKDRPGKQIVVTVASHDARTATDDVGRLVLVAAGDSVIVATRGECVSAADAAPAAVTACQAALATLDPAIAANSRVELSMSPEPPPAASPAPAAPLLRDVTRAPIPPIVVHQETPRTDPRPLYVGIGLVLLGTVFWWNRRRRERFEREEKPDDR